MKKSDQNWDQQMSWSFFWRRKRKTWTFSNRGTMHCLVLKNEKESHPLWFEMLTHNSGRFYIYISLILQNRTSHFPKFLLIPFNLNIIIYFHPPVSRMYLAIAIEFGALSQWHNMSSFFIMHHFYDTMLLSSMGITVM